MAEGLSAGVMKNIYGLLTTGSGDVNFCCSCIRNRNKELAFSKPLNFGVKLLKVNVMCRIPYIKEKLFSVPIGEKCLSHTFVRPEICDIASGMLDNTRVITDIFDSVLVGVKDKKRIYRELEEQSGVIGFAEARAALDKSDKDICEIYRTINSKLGCGLTPEAELEATEKNYIKNRYAARLIDIALCNGVSVTAAIKSCYPKEFIERLFKQFKISVDELIVCKNSDEFRSILISGKTAVLSSDFEKYIKLFLKKGCAPIYYRNPKLMLKQAKHPKLSNDFRDIYDGVCGTRIFSGKERYSFLYELFYLCVSPAVFGFAEKAVSSSRCGERIFCNCSEDSLFGQILIKLADDPDKLAFSDTDESKICSADIARLSYGKNNENTFAQYMNLSAERIADLEKLLTVSGVIFENNKNAFKTVQKAIGDFADDFSRYCKKSGTAADFSSNDVRELYLCAEKRLFADMG